jgi:hypothetical protein
MLCIQQRTKLHTANNQTTTTNQASLCSPYKQTLWRLPWYVEKGATSMPTASFTHGSQQVRVVSCMVANLHKRSHCRVQRLAEKTAHIPLYMLSIQYKLQSLVPLYNNITQFTILFMQECQTNLYKRIQRLLFIQVQQPSTLPVLHMLSILLETRCTLHITKANVVILTISIITMELYQKDKVTRTLQTIVNSSVTQMEPCANSTNGNLPIKCVKYLTLSLLRRFLCKEQK